MEPLHLNHKVRKPRDWAAMLMPSLIGVAAALIGSSVTSYTAHTAVSAALAAQVANHEVRIAAVEEVITALPKAYIPRVEFDHAETERSKIAQMRDAQLNRMELQIDTLVQTLMQRK